jgi:hypothetical protein
MENKVGLRSGGFRTRGPKHFGANIPNRYGTILVEDVQADQIIRLENLPPNLPSKDFLSLLAVADSAGSSNNSICKRLTLMEAT